MANCSSENQIEPAWPGRIQVAPNDMERVRLKRTGD